MRGATQLYKQDIWMEQDMGNLIQKKYPCMGASAMRPSWTYKLGQNIISIGKKEKDLGAVIQDN